MAEAPRSFMRNLFSRHSTPAFAVGYWDGVEDRFGSGPMLFRLTFDSPKALSRSLDPSGLGFGEAYMDGGIGVEGDLRDAVSLAYAPAFQRVGVTLGDFLRFNWMRLRQTNRLSQTRRNIRHHYSLGNSFYRVWLDRNLTYSCAYFSAPGVSLDEAQIAKVDLICRKLGLQPGERFLDIGCGWGHLLLHATENYRVRSHGITLCRKQLAYVETEIERRGLQDRCSVSLVDYRVLEGTFEKIASVGMFEHVGKRFIRLYLQKMNDLLAPGGMALLHTIGVAQPRPVDAWLSKHIFPGHYLPLPADIFSNVIGTDLVVLDLENLRPHYEITLSAWLENFERALSEVRNLGFDDRFIRMWRLYLAASTVAFQRGNYQLYQILFVKGVRYDLPPTRDHLYPANAK